MSDVVAQLACLQLQPLVGDPEGNLSRALAAIDAEATAGANFFVLPELATSGYAFLDRDEARHHAEPLGGPATTALCAASRGGRVVVAGFCELGDDGAVYNSAILAEDGELQCCYRKLHLWGDEPDCFTPGSAPPPVVTTRFGAVGVAICYDLEFPEVARSLALAGAELLALPTNWPAVSTPPGERPMLHTIAMATARLSRVWVAVCDRSGHERGIDYLGGSVIAGPDGWPRASSDPSQPSAVLRAECDLAAARSKRLGPRNDAFADRRPQFYSNPHDR